MSFLRRLFGDENARALKRAEPVAGQVNTLEEQFKALSDEDLKAKTGEFKARLEKGETLDSLMPEAFAAGHADIVLLHAFQHARAGRACDQAERSRP